MAKRKRLTPADPSKTPVLETKTMFPKHKDGWEGIRAPIAHVAGDAAASAALAELTDEMATARATGRMILELPLADIDPAYLVRDRVAVDEGEMQSLMDSLRARGQQTPIEVADLGPEAVPRYGLISGWRRMQALGRLSAEDGTARPALALLRTPQDATEAYLAMVEENEIRVGLSYYERARIAVVAVDQGVFDSEKQALQRIYHAASRAKRSKIRSFLSVVRALDGALAFPTSLGERAGLALSKALSEDAGLGARLRENLQATPPKTAEEEASMIATALRPAPIKEAPAKPAELPAGVRAQVQPNGALKLSGPGFTPALRDRLLDWLRQQ